MIRSEGSFLLTKQGLINDLGGSVIAAYDNTGEVIAVACADTQIIMLFSTSAIDSVSPACLAGSHLLDPPCAQA